MDYEKEEIEQYLKAVRDAIERTVSELSWLDFCKILQDEHPGNENQLLYVFSKQMELTERFGTGRKKVDLYIKLRQTDDNYVIIISFHEQKFKLRTYFR